MSLPEPDLAYSKCVSALEDFVLSAGFSDVVIGLSGGIDSSLVATIAVDAFGCSKVHGVLLPGPFSSKGSIDDALELATSLDISTLTIPIDTAYDAVRNSYKASVGSELIGLASENTQARLRMIYLMALSNQNGWMMLNTGNKSEAAMGYSTLYGDTAGAFAPIGGLYKTEVFQLSKWRNAKATSEGKKVPIPISVIEKPPSAELSADQTDEDSMGISYSELDSILIAINENAESIDSLLSKGFKLSQIESVMTRFRANEFKRALEPPFIEVNHI